MNKKTAAIKILLGALLLFATFAPIFAGASTGGTYTTPAIWPTGFWGPLVSCTGNYMDASANQCTNLCDLIDTFINVVYFAMSVAIFIITPISFLIGGVMYMLAGANPGMLESAKKTLLSTAIGLAIVLCSYLIVNTVITVLGISGVGGFGAAACSA